MSGAAGGCEPNSWRRAAPLTAPCWYSSVCPPLPLPLREHLLEQVERSWVVRLTQPEQCFLADLGIFVRPRDCDQRRNPFLARPLRQCEHRALADLAIDAIVDHDLLEILRGSVACCLAEPEDSLRPGTVWEIRVSGNLEECRPDIGAVGERRREDRLLSHAALLALRQRDEVIGRLSRRYPA